MAALLSMRSSPLGVMGRNEEKHRCLCTHACAYLEKGSKHHREAVLSGVWKEGEKNRMLVRARGAGDEKEM